MQHDGTSTKLMELVRNISLEIGVMKGKSILSLDDDLL